MHPALLLRLIWLLPLTLGAALCLYSAAVILIHLFSPGLPWASRGSYLPLLLGAAGVVYAAWRGWRGFARALSGKQPLSGAREAKGAAAAMLLLGVLTVFALTSVSNLVRYSAGGRQRGELTSVRLRLEAYKLSLGRFPSREADVEAMVREASLRGLWDTWLNAFPHKPTRAVVFYPEREYRDSGAWAYVSNPKSRDFGAFYIDCTHADSSSGHTWSSF